MLKPAVLIARKEICRRLSAGGLACLGIRFFVGCALIIPMLIQTILLDASGARRVQPQMPA
jgi:hypothetical protein